MDADEIETLVSNQRRELMAASAAESDLDLAFRLQMEEAMAASLAIQPSSSSSSPPRLPSPPPDSDLSNLISLQTLELDRFRQEKEDSERSHAEMNRLAADLRRRAHDELFAREIHQMPEDEWEEFGDNFERPIEAVGKEEERPFRLYFKGMASDEKVNGAVAQLVGIGVAVCDPRDKLVFKIEKPLFGVGSSREVLEVKALIEGLNAALALGIKSIDVFFDYRTLHNHVTGKWIVKQRKVANLISQVLLLQRKFDRCQLLLVPRCYIKFAFKLARDAIDSQITKKVELNGSKDVETCQICMEDTDFTHMFAVDGCLHRFCFSCMKQHVEVKLLHGMLPVCPHDGCNNKLNVESCKKYLPAKLLEIMVQRIKEESIPVTQKIYCPYPTCSALMSVNEAIRPGQESSKQPAFGTSGLRKCIKCNQCFCIKCKVPWHDRMSCYDYKRLNPHNQAEEFKLKVLARQNLWRQCVKCNHMIELAEGCFHMTCRCGYEFCYICGAEWKDKKATCSCPLWDEENILYDDSEVDDSDDYFENEDDYDEYEDSEDDDHFLLR